MTMIYIIILINPLIKLIFYQVDQASLTNYIDTQWKFLLGFNLVIVLSDWVLTLNALFRATNKLKYWVCVHCLPYPWRELRDASAHRWIGRSGTLDTERGGAVCVPLAAHLAIERSATVSLTRAFAILTEADHTISDGYDEQESRTTRRLFHNIDGNFL